MGDQWHYSRGGKQCGPVSAAELKRLAASGELFQTDMVWTEGMAAWSPATSVRGLFSSNAVPTHAAPPPLPHNPPTQSPTSGTGICVFCRKPMPADAIQCSSCRNWRQDIHLLIDTYSKQALAFYVAIAVGTALASLLFVAAKANATTAFVMRADGGWDLNHFSFDKFVASPWFAPGVLITVAVVAVCIVGWAHDRRTRHQIERVTRGLWKRPWWTF